MAGGYRELEDVTADVGIRAWGSTLTEAILFTSEGLFSFISNLGTLTGSDSRTISIKAPDLDSLLINFLNEIIFLEETESFLPKAVESLVLEDQALTAVVKGDIYDPSKHDTNIHVKAATYHGLVIKEGPDGWEVEVIFDV